MFLDGPDGWVVVLGCAHAGVINTLDYIAKLTGATQFRAVLGGMHLLCASPERIQATIATLERYQVQTVAANHCTGRQALIAMATVLGDRCCDGRVGTCWQFSNVT
ncbi:MBL fold metallo-hydrolase [Trichothermofontia sichuanensis B231]|uniref:MBL fold metallo-hydrolase n=1 Tax=Trichothermofontia sichuanensis TaxID=3045816 RepID=UPI0022475DC2|nr:MBL fold metallo-hydrolase [Trichothermofontia sichuanensis]UZQ54926.1 MBL fold metallo-hydrolase [Trichothermofontia sichuanensis B231]